MSSVWSSITSDIGSVATEATSAGTAQSILGMYPRLTHMTSAGSIFTDATSWGGSIATDATSLGGSVASEATSFGGSIASQATSLGGSLASDATSIGASIATEVTCEYTATHRSPPRSIL